MLSHNTAKILMNRANSKHTCVPGFTVYECLYLIQTHCAYIGNGKKLFTLQQIQSAVARNANWHRLDAILIFL